MRVFQQNRSNMILVCICFSDLFSVINVNADHVAEYTRRYLPQEWMQARSAFVTWDINNSHHPPLDWLQEFWKFLGSHFKKLSRFIEIPLIPVSPLSNSKPVLLAKLEAKTTLILQKSRQSSLPKSIVQVVTNAGGTVVTGNEWLKHEDLETYVLSPSPTNVLKLLMNLDSQHLIRALNAESHTAREELKHYLSHLNPLSGKEKDFLLTLPLFQTMKRSYVGAQLKQALDVLSCPTVPTELPMPDTVIQCATAADRRLLQLLKVDVLSPADAAIVLTDCIEKGTCSMKETEKIMAWILQHGNILFSQNQHLKRRCTDLRFIKISGEFIKTSKLFDPRNKTFKVIFESDFFPPPVYTGTQQMMESLTDLGLMNKESDVTPEHLLHVATQIAKLHVNSKTEAFKRAQALLEMLDGNDLLSTFSDGQLHQLKMIKWVPCDQPGYGKQQHVDKSQKNCFYSPDEIRHTMYEDIVGYVMPLMGKLRDKVGTRLGLKRLPPPEKVIENLSVLKSKAQKMTDPYKNVDFKRKLHSLYRHMQDNIPSFGQLMNKEPCWLWAHNQFVSPQTLVLDYPPDLDLSSFIVKVPNEYLPYTKLLLKFGLKPSLSNENITYILYSIQKNIEARQQPLASPAEVKVSIEILNWLWRKKQTLQDDIPVPVIVKDETFTLKPRSEALFCDVSKNRLTELQFSQEKINVLHEEIPIATAEWLQIRFLSNYILAPELVGIEQCGQFEPITLRIKNILKEYDEDGDIFKELIQNAEDAGADACKFLVDFRVHKDPPESLIDPNMALCQGLCLWSFNNEQFTDEDWKNIVRVGSASKENKVEKIGKFGLGFNTVYHVTDVPSILSGSKLLILDPNVTHLKRHIQQKTNPGIKLDLSQKRLLNCFPGQFGPYEGIFDCNLSRESSPEHFVGTLIKLPFRSEEEAVKSEISSKVYHKNDIMTLQQNFANNSQTHLIFLKNINTLSLQSISNSVSTPPRDEDIKSILTISKTDVKIVSVANEALISTQRQAEKSLIKLDVKCKEIIDSCSIHILQIAVQQCGKTEQQYWLVYNCFGTARSLEICLQENKKATFSLPVGGIAVPLKKNPKNGKVSPLQKDFVGQGFCFLPLPINTGLPVNVNGTFAVMSNRKGLWESGLKHEWNKALLQDPVVTAYITALSALKEMSENNQLESYCYHTFWPKREKVADTFKPLVDAFYSVVAHPSNGPELFSDGKHWCSMNNVIFLHESIQEHKDIGPLAAQMCQKFTKSHNCFVPLPLWLRYSFKQAGLETVLQNRTWNWKKFYQEIVFKYLNEMDPKSRDTLVIHAIDLKMKEVDNLLVCYPCIPTTDGKLQYIKKLVNPTGRVACLFEPEEGRLLGGTKTDFCSRKRIQRLLELGMANDNLPMEDITQKAGTITEIWAFDQKKAYERLKCLLELLKNHMDDNDSAHWETLRKTPFLPAFSSGDIRMERKASLEMPREIFSDKFSLLVNMTHPVLDHGGLKIHNNDPVLELLGVQTSPEPETVLQQLQEVCKKSQSTDTSMLHKIAYECYKFLDQQISGCKNTTLILQRANSFPFILIGNTFVNINSVAEDEQFEAKPYLHVLPPAFTSFRNLWEMVGVEKKFTTTQFRSVLKKLQSKYGKKPLPTNDLSICLTILSKGIFEAKEKTTDDCLIPNEHGVLQPARELFYNDSPWMPVASGITLCHENIPRSMACHFGITTTKHHTLEAHRADNSPFSFEFEQHEQLTVRIKNIISAYPSKKDILKELIQNADDAEATEIHFVWDKRQHGKEKTFGKRWNNLQGPALCVFNNRIFSDEDLKGIQHLGEGGKQQLVGKIGKYGVGFNSVYHLTDCPSILTGDELLCIFDPNRKYIESHSDKPNAGIGYNLADTFKAMYKDVYNSFLPDKFCLKNGTMFRLPLRTSTGAKNSKISQQHVTDRDINELCSALSEDPEGLILFLKNICKIKVHEIDEKSGNLKTTFVVEKHLPNKSREKKDAFTEQLQNALQSENPVTPQKVFYETTVSTSEKIQSEWIIAEQFGSFKDNDKLPLADKLPQGAIAVQMNTKGSNPPQFSKMEFEGAAFCSLPLPGKTGLPVHVNGNFEVDSARKTLWKEDGQSLKSNWNESLKQNIVAPLYADLLHYIRQRIKVKTGFFSSIELHFRTSYLCFWPIVSKNVAPEWHEMIQGVYRSIEEKALDVIPVLRSSTSKIADRTIKEYSFGWSNLSETGTIQAPYLTDNENEKINSILEDIGMKLVPAFANMREIWSTFGSAGVEVKKVTPASVCTFLQAKPLNDPTRTDEELPLPIDTTLIRDKGRCSDLLHFCLKDSELGKNAKNGVTLLNGLPLLLTKDKILRQFNSESPKLISKYDTLFSGYEDTFADCKIYEAHIDLLQTFNLVKKLTLPSAMQYLRPIIQHLLQSCEVDPGSGLHVPNETVLKWLEWLWRFITSEISFETSRAAEQSLTINDVRKLFSDCSILPVVCPKLNNKHLLQTMKEMSSVIPHASDKDLSSILLKLGFTKLDNVFFLKTYPHLSSALHAELMDVNDKSAVLNQVCNINHSKYSHLSANDMKEFQSFLQSGVSKCENRQDYEWKFRSLPIFETTHGDRVTIDGPKEVFVLNSIQSVKFPHLFTLSKSNIFLKYSSENYELSEILNIKILDDLEYFMKFILPAVQRLTEQETLDCLKLLLILQCDYSFSQYKDKVISSLKPLKLIRSCHGRLEIASLFFDDHVVLYQKMVPQEKFVPEKFWRDLCEEDQRKKTEARNLVRELGMKHEVSTDDIINFATQIESEAKGNNNVNELRQKSELLFNEALIKVLTNKDEMLLRRIADIQFIFPVKIREELCSYHQPCAAENTVVQIRGSLIDRDPNHQELIWSSMPIIHLPVYISQKLLQMMKNAGAHEQPPSQYVTSNMTNICQSPCETEQLIKTRAEVFRRAYANLQATAFAEQPLSDLPVVLVEKDAALCKADDVCLSLEHDLDFRPYLFKIPPQDVLYAEFFKKIGVKPDATAVHYCNVLAAVCADSCDKKQLNFNQKKTVKRAVQQLFHLIKRQKHQVFTDDVQTLCLPAVDGKLYPSSSLYYNDTAFETKRLEEALEDKFLLLEKLSKCHLGKDIYEHHRLVQLLPQKFRPKMLSQITEEKIVEPHLQLCELGIDCDFSGWFDKHLSSGAFRHGVVCLLREQSQGQISQQEENEMCEKIFGSIQIVCCKTLETMLWMNTQPLKPTTRETDVFVKREQQGCTFYLKHHDDMAPKVINEVNMTLTKEINALLDHRIESAHLLVLGQLLMCDDLKDVQQTLAKNQIRDSAETENIFLNQDPGTDVPDEWYDSLDMSFLNNFEEGEYVGYSINDKYIYAVIVEELPEHAGRYTKRYKIDIGEDEPIEVGHLDLYQFKRDKKLKVHETTDTSSMELVKHDGAASPSSHSSTSSLPTSLDEAKREIDKCLNEIWGLPEEERRKGIKRLYLRWHPDKNPDCLPLATESFKYLQNRIDELSKGKTLTATTNSSYSSRSSGYRNFYQQWDQEARHHRSGRERFFRSYHSYNFWSHNTNIPKPNKKEAQRWFKQARCDLDAAQVDTSGKSTEWCFFKVHQAVEKALFAAEYKRNGRHSTGNSIFTIAAEVSNYHPQLKVLLQIVTDLKALGVDAKKTQYPSYHPYPHIPNEQFRSEKAMVALSKACELLRKIEEYVGN